MAKDLRSFLQSLTETRSHEIAVVDSELDWHCGPTAVVEKLEKQHRYPIVYCKKIRGSEIPLIINLGASYDRMALAIGADSIHGLHKVLAEREAHPLPLK